MDNEPTAQPRDQTTAHRRADGADLIVAALAHLQASLSGDGGPPEEASFARQETCLTAWAKSLGLLLDPDDLPAKAVKGGQEHEIWHDESTDRFWKITRDRVFGLTPGIDLALVSTGEDARRFHLWEATPWQYLERLRLHNLLVPEINRLEGFISQPDDLSIITSQPRFDSVPVSQEEIDHWFAKLGFQRVTTAAYYRAEDNLGIFDAHDKNVFRVNASLIPFDIIPCQPTGGFLTFINETIAEGNQLTAVRTTHTTTANTPPPQS